MTDERRQRILQVADELEAEGLEATNSAVYSRALGHRGDVVTVMKARRAERGNGGTVAVADDDDDEIPQPTASELEEDLRQLESSYESLHVSLERIWALDNEGGLDEATFTRKLWLENTLTKNLQQQEALRPQLELAKLTEALATAQQTHDALVPEVLSQAETVIEILAELGAAVQAFVHTVETQTAQFFPFRDRRGHQAFDLRSGRQEAVDLLQRAYPVDFRASDLVNLLLDAPLRVGQADDALESSPRFQPFSPRALERYLATLTPEGVSS
jgi:hypothetical protein